MNECCSAIIVKLKSLASNYYFLWSKSFYV